MSEKGEVPSSSPTYNMSLKLYPSQKLKKKQPRVGGILEFKCEKGYVLSIIIRYDFIDW